MSWYTEQLPDEHYRLNIEFIVTDFEDPEEDEANPRFCLGLRERGSNDLWDLGLMSMDTWKDKEWLTKDGMEEDPINFCGNAVYDYVPE